MFILIDGRRSSIEDRRDDPLAKSKKWNATYFIPTREVRAKRRDQGYRIPSAKA